MYPYDIEIDGYRASDDEQWRITRIKMVLAYAQALADAADNESFYKKVKSLYDDEGTLTVSWLVPPTDEEKEMFNNAWNSVVTDFEENVVEHL